ncbi:MAG: single-stranded DNA-binding protein [Candidatus Egerieousia sp.]
MSFNRVLLLGNVGRDPEIRHFEGGAAVANFTVATSERFRDKSGTMQERTEWHNVVCRNPLSDVVEKYVRKGTQVFVEGKIRTRNYTDQSGQKRYVTEIHVDTLQLVGRKADNPATQGGYSAPQGGYSAPQQQYNAPQQFTPAQQQAPVRNDDFPDAQDFSAGADDLPF